MIFEDPVPGYHILRSCNQFQDIIHGIPSRPEPKPEEKDAQKSSTTTAASSAAEKCKRNKATHPPAPDPIGHLGLPPQLRRVIRNESDPIPTTSHQSERYE